MGKYTFLAILLFTGAAHAAPSSQREITGAVIRNGSGKVMMNTSGSATIPNGTYTVVGKDTTDVLTNKTVERGLFSGGVFTASTLVGASGSLAGPLVSGAIITTSTLGTPVINTPLVSGGVQTSTTLLSPSSTTPLVSGGVFTAATFAGNITTPLTASRALVLDGSSRITAATTTATELGYVNGVTSAIQTQINSVSFAASNSYKLSNCSLAASVAASALTVALKDASGSDPSAGSPCTVGFRNATATTGTYADVSATAATSVVVSNGSSLGCIASTACTLHIYAINNAGTLVLGVVSYALFDEGTVQTSTTEGGAGGADTGGTLYATTGVASKAVRLLGRVTIAPAASFAWTNAATEISNVPFRDSRDTNWVSWTPTGSWSLNVTYSGRWRRVGDTAEYEVLVSLTGATTTASLTITLPSGHVIDTTKITSTNGNGALPGGGSILDSGSAAYFAQVGYSTTTAVAIWAQNAGGTYLGITDVTQAVPMTFANGDFVKVNFKVPIVGW